MFANVVSSVSLYLGGVGRSDALAGRESIPSPSPPTSVRYVLNVSDVYFSDSSVEMREVNLNGEKSVDERRQSVHRVTRDKESSRGLSLVTKRIVETDPLV